MRRNILSRGNRRSKGPEAGRGLAYLLVRDLQRSRNNKMQRERDKL